jgi:hypothetical protein
MKTVRLAVVLGCLTQIVSACGCPDIGVPSLIEMTLPASMGERAYSVEVCINSSCEVFEDVEEGVTTSSDGEVELEVLSSNSLRYTSWRQIAPGTHNVAVDVSDEGGGFADFEGAVEFDEIDRCHTEDSEATIELVASE